jgi:ribosome-interacting GTPase 1
MPTNLPREWSLIENEYREAKSLDEKIETLKRLISATPKNKATENLLADLRRKLSKLEKQLEKRSKKSGARKDVIKKTADIMVSIIGLTQSGKSTLLKSLTNASVKIEYGQYITKQPVTGVAFFEGVDIQFVEIPSFFLKNHMNIAHCSDLLLLLTRKDDDLIELENVLKENRLENKKRIVLDTSIEKEKLLHDIIKEVNIIRIFMKPIGKKPERKAFVMKNNCTVRDLIEKINEDWLKIFRFVRIFDDTKFSGRQAGLDYILKDKDIVEIHML